MTARKFSTKDLQVSAFDPVTYLDSDEAIAAYLEIALAENDPVFLMAALNDVIRARGVADIASKAGLGRESLYKTLKPGAHPRLSTVLQLLGALDIRLSITPAKSARTAKKNCIEKVCRHEEGKDDFHARPSRPGQDGAETACNDQTDDQDRSDAQSAPGLIICA